MPTISAEGQGGAQRSEQYLEAWTGRRASARAPPAGRRRYNQAALRVWLCSLRKCERGNESERRTAPAALERSKAGGEPPGLGVQDVKRSAGGSPAAEGGVGAGGSAASRRCRGRSDAEASDPAEWSRSGDESAEAALARSQSRLRPQRRDGRPAEQNAGAPSTAARARRIPAQPASGRCGVSPLERGERDARLARWERRFSGKCRSQVRSNQCSRRTLNRFGGMACSTKCSRHACPYIVAIGPPWWIDSCALWIFHLDNRMRI